MPEPQKGDDIYAEILSRQAGRPPLPTALGACPLHVCVLRYESSLMAQNPQRLVSLHILELANGV
ncbi:hypothetical protein [Candidatus Entotheonella palauensis]|nr:hypothetical protein [Candidatus Entotheonella palauensis]